MNINKFKEGDIITRIEPCKYSFNTTADSSYCGDKIRFLGCEKKIIFFQILDSHWGDDIHDLSFARDSWDEGWDYYPESLYQKIVKKWSKPKESQSNPTA